jgi:hypothetical protein
MSFDTVYSMLINSIGVSAFRVVEGTRLSYTTVALMLCRAITDYAIPAVQYAVTILFPAFGIHVYVFTDMRGRKDWTNAKITI